MRRVLGIEHRWYQVFSTISGLVSVSGIDGGTGTQSKYRYRPITNFDVTMIQYTFEVFCFTRLSREDTYIQNVCKMF